VGIACHQPELTASRFSVCEIALIYLLKVAKMYLSIPGLFTAALPLPTLWYVIRTNNSWWLTSLRPFFGLVPVVGTATRCHEMGFGSRYQSHKSPRVPRTIFDVLFRPFHPVPRCGPRLTTVRQHTDDRCILPGSLLVPQIYRVPRVTKNLHRLTRPHQPTARRLLYLQ
jgi:hypothetical protein